MTKSKYWKYVVAVIVFVIIGGLISLGTELFNDARTFDTMRLAFFKGMALVGGAATVLCLIFALIDLLVPYSSRRNKRIRWTSKGVVWGAFNAFASTSVMGSDAGLPTLENVFLACSSVGPDLLPLFAGAF